MSVTLNRREFVAGVTALLAAPADAPLFSFALVTDTHLPRFTT